MLPSLPRSQSAPYASPTSIQAAFFPSKRPRAMPQIGGAILSPLVDDKQIVPFVENEALVLPDFIGSGFLEDAFVEDEPLAHPLDWDSMRCSYKCRQMVKSEVLETLNAQEKLIKELDSTVRSLRSRNDTAESQVKNLQLQVESLEQEVAGANGREKGAQTHFLRESEQLEERLRLQLKRCSELEMMLQKEMQLRSEAEAKASAAENRVESVKEAKEKAAEAFKWEIRSLKQELERSQKDSIFNISRVKAEIAAEKKRTIAAQAEAQALETQCEVLQKHLSESMNVQREMDQKLANASNSSLPFQSCEMEVIIRHLRDELSHCESDVAEARKLKQFHVNADLLKEKIESERQRADRAEMALGDFANVQLQVKELEKELQDWKNMIEELPGVETRSDIPRRILNLQREVISGMAQVGQLTSQVKELQVTLEKAESAQHKAETNADASREAVTEATISVKRLEQKIQLLMKERDGLKAILASYDEEEAVIIKQHRHGEFASVLSTPEKAKDRRIQELEALLTTLENENDALQSKIAKLESKVDVDM